MLALVLLIAAILATLGFIHTKGGAKLFLGFLMLVTLAGFLVNVAQFAHAGM